KEAAKAVQLTFLFSQQIGGSLPFFQPSRHLVWTPQYIWPTKLPPSSFITRRTDALICSLWAETDPNMLHESGISSGSLEDHGGPTLDIVTDVFRRQLMTFSQRDAASNVTTNGAQNKELRARVLVQMRLKRRHWTGRLDVGAPYFLESLKLLHLQSDIASGQLKKHETSVR
ncbi:hypothetical protein N5P37_006019, partial [Trichoderma harzianum]